MPRPAARPASGPIHERVGRCCRGRRGGCGRRGRRCGRRCVRWRRGRRRLGRRDALHARPVCRRPGGRPRKWSGPASGPVRPPRRPSTRASSSSSVPSGSGTASRAPRAPGHGCSVLDFKMRAGIGAAACLRRAWITLAAPVHRSQPMKTRAAVAWKAGAPLTIETVDLEGPKAGEVLVEVKATGICHTDQFTLSGADPEGLFPAILGHEGAGVVLEVGPGVTSLKRDDHVIPLYTPECRQCKFCLSRKTNLCQAIRATQGKGPDARRHVALLDRRPADPALHGHDHLRQPHRRARDRAGEDPQRRAVRQGLLHRLRRDHRRRRGAVHGQGRGRRQRGRVRPRRHRPERDPGREDGRRRQDHRHRSEPGARGDGATLRHDALHQPEAGRERRRRASCSSPTAAPTTASSASATRRRCARRSSAATRAGARA